MYQLYNKFAPTVQNKHKPTKMRPELVCKILFSDNEVRKDDECQCDSEFYNILEYSLRMNAAPSAILTHKI